jgi:hypothetical protein
LASGPFLIVIFLLERLPKIESPGLRALVARKAGSH